MDTENKAVLLRNARHALEIGADLVALASLETLLLMRWLVSEEEEPEVKRVIRLVEGGTREEAVRELEALG